jgi:hypothetical protein
MNTYTARFTGRAVGSIGRRYYIVTVVKAKDKEKANILLYNEYEHISGLQLLEHDGDIMDEATANRLLVVCKTALKAIENDDNELGLGEEEYCNLVDSLTSAIKRAK